MSDVKCPHCKHEQEINNDDGYGYSEGDVHEQDCIICDKRFGFVTSISFDYEVFCEDDDHDMQHSGHKDLYECSRCDYHCLEIVL